MPDNSLAYQLARRAQGLAVRKRRRRMRVQCGHPPTPRTTISEPAYSATQRAGHAAEMLAARKLTQMGLLLLARNMRCKAGEIDLIAMDGKTLVFIEVRQRQSRHYGGAAASVNRHKQQRLIRAAHYFLPALTRRYFAGLTPACRFDVISVEPKGTTWIKQAFCVS